ncbi:MULTISPECIES: UV DNA damage repair endonuclease UvsE [unclassified Methanoregula]|uniref:UV DNA damage repair endonuclease UvsE n=1 Tax=unclassified Methanoregula TaxID=2649730 RepID=UPI0009D5C4AA|nr:MULTISPECIES: UV DNA damage repair endonuclease UvsE [unclassified Methanoregula]OPX63796.1 MAG: putative UV damage endonuclease [Methanoregula sp. PtaB.Bin085]OPY36663.1 MAG: putative UV damage endonuclease [Methanoregula sp. PtaU1.Bin006]
MRIGYPCINRSIGCTANRTFRLAAYSDKHLLETVKENIACLQKILAWNRNRDILFFRITSVLVPFASHRVCTAPWQVTFADDLAAAGELIRNSGMRISMHPDQFIILNAPDPGVVERSIAELMYHAEVLDLMELPPSAKIQLHAGGVYGDAAKSIDRFVRTYETLDPVIRRRLVVENDDQRFTASDCLAIHERTGIPVLFDVFHHACANRGEDTKTMIDRVRKTWKGADGIMMADYSSQHPDKRPGGHADHIDLQDFARFLAISQPWDMDIMLEIKDKEASALAAVEAARADPRFAGKSSDALG